MITTNKMAEQPDINKVLSDISSALVGHFNMPTLLNQVVEMSMRTLHAEVCSIFLEDKENEPGVLIMKAGSGFARALVEKAKYNIGEGFTGVIAKYGQKFNIKSRQELNMLEVDGERVWRGKFDEEQWPSGQSQFRNCIAFPLRIKDQILGVIKVENKYPENGSHFIEEDEKYFETIANVVALAIENARLHEQIERQLKTIAAKAAHRINNQITNYDGIELELLEQVESAVADKQKLEEILIRINETTKNLKRMVGEFKSYGKPIRIQKALYNINKIIEDEIWHAGPHGIKIEKFLDERIPLVPLDAARFAEAIKELLRNSIKALSQNPVYKNRAAIYISTKLVEQEDENARRMGKLRQIVIDLWDNGPGFPASFPIFDAFQSTDTQSTGLGLATVKELVEAHGGQIEALQDKGEGAHISITLPF